MCQTPDLCGNFELDEDTGYIVWNLYENIRIGIDVYGTDCCLTLADWFSERSKTVLRIGILMCWKSTTKSAMSENAGNVMALCFSPGKRVNRTVLRKKGSLSI